MTDNSGIDVARGLKERFEDVEPADPGMGDISQPLPGAMYLCGDRRRRIAVPVVIAREPDRVDEVRGDEG